MFLRDYQVSISSTFCSCFFAKKPQSQTVIREKLRKALSYEKQARKMLMKFESNPKIEVFGKKRVEK